MYLNKKLILLAEMQGNLKCYYYLSIETVVFEFNFPFVYLGILTSENLYRLLHNFKLRGLQSPEFHTQIKVAEI